MKDRTPVLYTLKRIIDDKVPFQLALEKAEQFYNLSSEDKKKLTNLVVGVLRHQYILRLEIETNFPKYAANDDESLLLCIALFEMRKAKGEEERLSIINEISHTITARGMKFDNEDIGKILLESKDRFSIPEKYKEDPYKYNSYLFNVHPWIIREYFEEFGGKKALELIKSTLDVPTLYLGVNTTKASIKDYEEDSRFECIPTINTSFENGGTLLSKNQGRASNIQDVLDGRLFAQDLSYAKALDALPLMQYYRALHIGGRTGTTAASLATRLDGLSGSVSAAYLEDKQLARAKGLFRRLGLKNVNAYQSTLKMIKTVEEYDKYDLVVVTPSSTHTGQMRRRPDVNALFTIDQLGGLSNLQYESLVEASYFPRVGGLIEYIVPSILKSEGRKVIDRFMNDKTNVNQYKLVTEKVITPTKDSSGYESDGLYYAILIRTK